jgi:hypothetical protein
LLNEFPPFELGVADGKRWETPFKNGKTFASCFKNGGKNIAQGYPYWDEASQKVRTAEMDLNDCLKKNGEPEFTDLDKDQTMRVKLAQLTAYFYSLSAGQRIKIDLSSPGAVKAYEEGRSSGGSGAVNSTLRAPTVTWIWRARTSAAISRSAPRSATPRHGRPSVWNGVVWKPFTSATRPVIRRCAPSLSSTAARFTITFSSMKPT